MLWIGIASSGCLTARQDGHYDACSYLRSENGGWTTNADAHHGICLYDPTPAAPIEYPDPPAYEKGYLAGWDECWVRLYDERWDELDEGSPCAQVDEAP